MSFSIAPIQQFPYTAVCYLYVQLADGSFAQASGVLVSPDEVLTAAHVVDQAVAIQVIPAWNAVAAPYGIDFAASWTYLPGFQDGPLLSQQQSQSDIGLIRLRDNLGEKTGWMGLQGNFGSGQVNVTGYPGAYGGVMQTETAGVFRDPYYSVLDYPNGTVQPGSSGGPLWVNAAGGPQVVGTVSTGGWAAQLSPASLSFIQNDIATHVISDVNPGPFATTVAYTDVTTGASGSAPAPAYSGPVGYLDSEYVYLGADDLSVAASTPNMFLRSGSGNDALQASTGQNVLDGGTGSNFLVGSTGTDTFFVDGRGQGITWSTIVDFHQGDSVTLWGFVPGVSTDAWTASDGTAGFRGSTLHAALRGGGTDASMTFAFVDANVSSHFLLQTGSVQGNPYLHITYT